MPLTTALTTTVAGLLTTGLLLAPTSQPAYAGQVAQRAVVGGAADGDTLFPDQGNGGYDVEPLRPRHRLDAADGSITATATITDHHDDHATTAEPVLPRPRGPDVTAVTVNGAAGDLHAASPTPPRQFKLVVTPATPVNGEFTTVVTYSGTPSTHTDPDGSTEGWVAHAAAARSRSTSRSAR